MSMTFDVMPLYLALTLFEGSDDGSCSFALVWPISTNTSEVGVIIFCWLIDAEPKTSMTNLDFPPVRRKGWLGSPLRKSSNDFEANLLKICKERG